MMKNWLILIVVVIVVIVVDVVAVVVEMANELSDVVLENRMGPM